MESRRTLVVIRVNVMLPLILVSAVHLYNHDSALGNFDVTDDAEDYE